MTAVSRQKVVHLCHESKNPPSGSGENLLGGCANFQRSWGSVFALEEKFEPVVDETRDHVCHDYKNERRQFIHLCHPLSRAIARGRTTTCAFYNSAKIFSTTGKFLRLEKIFVVIYNANGTKL